MGAIDTVLCQAQVVVERWSVSGREAHAYFAEPAAHAVYDEVTGLPATRLFHAQVSQALAAAARHGRRVVVLGVDVSLGEPVLSASGASCEAWMMRIAAARAAGVLGSQDRLARIDAHRLAVVALDTAEAERAPRLVDHLQQALSAPVMIEGRCRALFCRIGCAMSGQDESSAEVLVASAVLSLTSPAQDQPVVGLSSCGFPSILPLPASPDSPLSLRTLHS